MGYVATEFARPGTELGLDVRGRLEPARVVELPFYRRSKKGTNHVTPEELLYTKTHEWVHVETDAAGAKIATVGLSGVRPGAADRPGLHRPARGRPQGDRRRTFGEIESVKAVSDLYSPVDGEIVEVNTALADKLDTLADDPYQAGWMVKIRLADESGLANLLDSAAYQKQCEQEAADH